jgi:hypothetical protein
MHVAMGGMKTARDGKTKTTLRFAFALTIVSRWSTEMSRENIVDITDIGVDLAAIGETLGGSVGAGVGEALNQVTGGGAIRVTFRLRNGRTMSYRYFGQDAIDIKNGADPKDYAGQRED